MAYLKERRNEMRNTTVPFILRMRNLVIPLALILLSAASCDESQSDRIKEYQLPDINLSEIEDGGYRGSFRYHKSTYETLVEVKNHRIENIQVLQAEWDKYDEMALPVLQNVIEQQSLQVDVVTGATKSCKLYLLTIHNALSDSKIEL